MRTFLKQSDNQANETTWWADFFLITVRILAVLLLLLFCQSKAKAQQTSVYTDETRYYNRALELFDKEKYGAAQKHFLWYASFTKDPLGKINASYYAAVCAMELFNPDAESMLLQIISLYPENTRAKMARFQLGKLYYRAKNNKAAVASLDLVQTSYLTGPDLLEFYFIYGYSLFKMERFDDAKKAFQPIKDEKSKYYEAANYYYGYVCYRSGSYDDALEHFARVKYSKTFGPLSTVYVAQVYFSRKQYKEVINYCDTITNPEVINDVAGMLGQSHYQMGNYQAAIPHLEKFMQAAPVAPANKDYYSLGYCYSQAGMHEKAIEQWLKMETGTDTLSRYTYYNLGKSYLALNKKSNAMTAFDKCYGLDSMSDMGSISLFQTAKLADELNLQGQAMQRYVKFIELYPEHDYIPEARSNLSYLLLNARNYKEAIRILEGIKKPTQSDKTTLQRVMYYRAEELYLNNNYAEANELFTKVSAETYDLKMTGLAWFWLAEQAYRESAFQKSIDLIRKFQSYPSVASTRFYNQSFYNLGYSYIKLEQYSKAVEAFVNYIEKEKSISNPEVYTDALVRTADCYFADSKYLQAVSYYDILINKDFNGADYALYQKGMILGVLGKNDEKVLVLKRLEKAFPKSPFIDDAVYEMADNYLKMENYAEAVVSFDNILKNYPRSVYLRKSILNKALALFNLKRDDEALAEIKKLITNYPGSDEAREALPMVQNIFVNQGKGEDYLDFVKVLPNVVISASTQDSLSWESAFNLYQQALKTEKKEPGKGNFDKPGKAFGNYISRFPGGYFILKANYFKAECDYKLKKYDDALICYEYVANSLRSDYTEWATRQSALLNFVRKNYDKSYEYYNALERIAGNRDNLQLALLGQMRSCTNGGRTDSAAQIAFRYLSSGIAQKEGSVEANIYIGRYYMKQNRFDSAQVAFVSILKESKSVYSAEAKYNIAVIQFNKKDYKGAQKTIFELNEKLSAFEYWVVRGFILLADTYVKQNDYFQAKATLQSILDEYTGEEIRAICRTKMDEINELEKKQKSDNQKQIDQRINQKEK